MTSQPGCLRPFSAPKPTSRQLSRVGWRRICWLACCGWLALSLLGGSGLGPTSAHADQGSANAAPPVELPEELEREAEAIARSVMSPFCPGRTVSSCPVAGPWRDDIRRWVGERVPADEIRKRLAERVPEHNLMGVPPNRLGWVLPVGLGLLAAASLFFLLKRLIKPAPAAPEAGSKASSAESATANGGAAPAAKAGKPEDWDARLEEELETLER
ncbi:MAG TPA: hypothetical protein VJU61_05075 [Polyangiaceae bacterium]|nr:hypothetical protein [Polyangiaceae bacterium]